jgi:hypothetical protein
MSIVRLALIAVTLILSLAPSRANPELWRAEGWTTDFEKASIAWTDVLSGGPPRDGIPSIDQPKFMAVLSIEDLVPQDPVMGLAINGDARAYPLRVLMWHEIANDVVGGVPVAITYCPLCNAAIVFERTVDGKVLDFGTTGKLRNSDLVMYDRQTQSWWQQFTGEAIVGSYLGTALKTVPARLESFADFKARFPAGQVLVPGDSASREYGRNPYEGYDSLPKPFLYGGAMPEGIEPLSRVVMVRANKAEPIIISLEALRAKGKVNIMGYAVSWKAGQASALDAGEIAKGRDVGSVVVTRDGSDVAYDVTFAFVAHAFHPDAEIMK